MASARFSTLFDRLCFFRRCLSSNHGLSVRPLRFGRSSPGWWTAHDFTSSKLVTVSPWSVDLHTSMAILLESWLNWSHQLNEFSLTKSGSKLESITVTQSQEEFEIG